MQLGQNKVKDHLLRKRGYKLQLILPIQKERGTPGFKIEGGRWGYPSWEAALTQPRRWRSCATPKAVSGLLALAQPPPSPLATVQMPFDGKTTKITSPHEVFPGLELLLTRSCDTGSPSGFGPTSALHNSRGRHSQFRLYMNSFLCRRWGCAPSPAA